MGTARKPLVRTQFQEQQLQAGDALLLPQIVTPTTPAATTAALYPKADGNLYMLLPSGVEVKVNGSGSRAFAFFMSRG